MTRKVLFGLLVLITVVSLLFAACAKTTSTTTAKPPPTSASSAAPPPSGGPPSGGPPSGGPPPTSGAPPTSQAPPPTSAPPPTAKGNWWDKQGIPEYGGMLAFQARQDAGNFDTWTVPWTATNWGWYENLLNYDWTVDRNTWSFKTSWAPPEYCVGNLLESWEFKDPTTLVGHVRQGVKWQNKAPSNGREFTAADIGYHFDRAFGTGSGFDKPNPWYLGWIPAIKGAKAIDKNTVEIYFKNPTPLVNMWSVIEMSMPTQIENPDTVKAGIGDWKNVCGTGPYMLTDYVQNAAATLTRNPDYWGFDSRYPKNRLPYADTVKVFVIQDMSTALSAIRTGKLDMLAQIEWQMAQALGKSNPEILQAPIPTNGYDLEMRVDNRPFRDVRVRIALQKAVNTEEIAKGYYGGFVSGKPGGIISPEYPGYSVPYDQWPADLQKEYSFDPTAAKKLLADAGYPTGFPTNCVMSSNDDSALLQVVKSYFKDVGVDMEIRNMDQTTYMQYTLAGKHDQMAFTFMTQQVQPPNISIYQYDSHNSTNYTHNNDAAFDALYDKYMTSATTEEAKKNYIAADMYFLKQHWMVNLTARVSFTAYQPYLKGYVGENPTGMTTSFYWKHFWVDQKAKAAMGR